MNKNKTNYLLHLITAAIVCICSINVTGQSVGISSGLGYSTFIDLKKNTTHSYANYEKGSYQFLRFDLDSYIPDAPFLSLHFKLERSISSIESIENNFNWCGLGFFPIAPIKNSQVTLYRMSVGFMPINFGIYKNIRFKAGTELSRVFKSSISERSNESNDFNDPIFIPTTTDDEDIINEYGVGFNFELQLGKFELGKDLHIIPIYNSSVSLSEDIQSGFYTRTLRQSLGLAIKWNMKPKLLMP